MGDLSDADVFVIKTLATYSVMDVLEQNKIIDKELFTSYYEKLSEIQKEIVSYFLVEKTEQTNLIRNYIEQNIIR